MNLDPAHASLGRHQGSPHSKQRTPLLPKLQSETLQHQHKRNHDLPTLKPPTHHPHFPKTRFTPQQGEDFPAPILQSQIRQHQHKHNPRLPIWKFAHTPPPISENQVHPTASSHTFRRRYFNHKSVDTSTNVNPTSHIETAANTLFRKPGSPHSKQPIPSAPILQSQIRQQQHKRNPRPSHIETTHTPPPISENQVHPTASSRYLKCNHCNNNRTHPHSKVLFPTHLEHPQNPPNWLCLFSTNWLWKPATAPGQTSSQRR